MATSVRLDERLSNKISALAKAQGMSKSQLIRQCLVNYVGSEEQEPTAWELGKHLFGCYRSGRRNRSVCAGKIAKEKINGKRAKTSRR